MADKLTIDKVADLIECGKHLQAIDLIIDYFGVDIAMTTLQVAQELTRRGKAELTTELLTKLGEYRRNGISSAYRRGTNLRNELNQGVM